MHKYKKINKTLKIKNTVSLNIIFPLLTITCHDMSAQFTQTESAVRWEKDHPETNWLLTWTIYVQ